jgi:hypothetical protein
MHMNGLRGSLMSPTSGRGAPLELPPKTVAKETDAADQSGGVLAQISDAAKSMFAQMKRDGIAAQSFELHLDLRQLGLTVDASGARSLEGHSLTIDLHVEAHQGTVKTDNGEYSFQSLDVSFSVEETWVRASEAKPQPARGGGLVDGLKKLVDLLDKTNGRPTAEDGLGAILAQIGRALEAMAKRVSDVKDAKPKEQPSEQLDGFYFQEEIRVQALHVEIATVHEAQTEAA